MSSVVDHVTVVTPRFPLPLKSGTQLREYHSLCELASRFDVTLVSLVQDDEANHYIEEIESLGVDVRTVTHHRTKPRAVIRTLISRKPYRVAKFVTPSFRRRIEAALADTQTDLLWVHFLGTIPALPNRTATPLILDEHNADLRYWRSFSDGSLTDRAFAKLNRRLIRNLQAAVRNRIDAVVSVSEEDATATRDWVNSPVTIAPNGVDTDRFAPSQPASEAEQTVVFVGSLDVRMNEEAIVWFVELSWERVLERCPNARLSIIGKNPTTRVQRLEEYDGVDVVGEVPDVVDYYDQAAVVVAPFQYGGGSKLKILEALSMERPLVTTDTGATGIDLVDGDEAILRQRGDGFTNAVVELLRNPERRDQFGKRGRAFVYEQYTWNRNMNNAIDTVLELIDEDEL